MTNLEQRVKLARQLQAATKVKASPEPTGRKQTLLQRKLKAIDRKHDIPKIRYFRQEYRYAMPPNVGDARNPLIFGKIPIEYQVIEAWENEQVLAKRNKQLNLFACRQANYR